MREAGGRSMGQITRKPRVTVGGCVGEGWGRCLWTQGNSRAVIVDDSTYICMRCLCDNEERLHECRDWGGLTRDYESDMDWGRKNGGESGGWGGA